MSITNCPPPQFTREQELNAEEENISQITPNLFIGNVDAAGKCRQRVPNYEEKERELKQRGITHIVCCTEDSVHYHEGKFSYYNVTLTDTDDADIISHLDGAYQFIEQAIKDEGKVLVHCGAGVSRSASVVIAYLMKKEGADYQNAFNFVKTQRLCVNPNRSFVKQLQSYNTI